MLLYRKHSVAANAPFRQRSSGTNYHSPVGNQAGKTRTFPIQCVG